MLDAQLMFAIMDRNRVKDFIAFYKLYEWPSAHVLLGHGSTAEEILNYLQLGEKEKAVLICGAGGNTVRKCMERMHRLQNLEEFGGALVLTVPVGSIGGQSTAKTLTQTNTIERREEPMEAQEAFALIITIAKEGYSNLVVEAARKKGGATGATIVHARGVGMDEEKKFFGISLSDERELVLIACHNRCKKQIMKAILEDPSAEKAKPVVFSLPVSDAGGQWIWKEEESKGG
ncbi:MAG: hypothetical protein LBR73_00615 [Oscillospiraceae bacterium]|jgi:hypothetical protein|nr:hypothetical protein [Oscillospiraceae bacterium]